jgi:hypothetical protein
MVLFKLLAIIRCNVNLIFYSFFAFSFITNRNDEPGGKIFSTTYTFANRRQQKKILGIEETIKNRNEHHFKSCVIKTI